MGVNLQKLSDLVNEALSKENKESFTEWFNEMEKKEQELNKMLGDKDLFKIYKLILSVKSLIPQQDIKNITGLDKEDLNNLAQKVLYSAPFNKWISYELRPIEIEDGDVIGYNPMWIDKKYNPKGVRMCFMAENGFLHSAKWDNERGEYIIDISEFPTHYMFIQEYP